MCVFVYVHTIMTITGDSPDFTKFLVFLVTSFSEIAFCDFCDLLIYDTEIIDCFTLHYITMTVLMLMWKQNRRRHGEKSWFPSCPMCHSLSALS